MLSLTSTNPLEHFFCTGIFFLFFNILKSWTPSNRGGGMKLSLQYRGFDGSKPRSLYQRLEKERTFLWTPTPFFEVRQRRNDLGNRVGSLARKVAYLARTNRREKWFFCHKLSTSIRLYFMGLINIFLLLLLFLLLQLRRHTVMLVAPVLSCLPPFQFRYTSSGVSLHHTSAILTCNTSHSVTLPMFCSIGLDASNSARADSALLGCIRRFSAWLDAPRLAGTSSVVRKQFSAKWTTISLRQ